MKGYGSSKTTKKDNIARVQWDEGAPNSKNKQPSAVGQFAKNILINHWGKVATALAAAVVVGIPYMRSHQQMNEQHPEFSAFSLNGISQRAYRTFQIYDDAIQYAIHRKEGYKSQLLDTFNRTYTESAPSNIAVVCYDKELLSQAAKGSPLAKAYLKAAKEELREQFEFLSQQNAPFYGKHMSFDPDAPVYAAAFNVNYNQAWSARASNAYHPRQTPTDLEVRPVAQWIAKGVAGACPSHTIPEQYALKLDFKQKFK